LIYIVLRRVLVGAMVLEAVRKRFAVSDEVTRAQLVFGICPAGITSVRTWKFTVT
jgi:hypothetical protein